MVGLPGQTVEHLLQDLKFFQQEDVDTRQKSATSRFKNITGKLDALARILLYLLASGCSRYVCL
jgi:hypothetical protein